MCLYERKRDGDRGEGDMQRSLVITFALPHSSQTHIHEELREEVGLFYKTLLITI